MNSTAVSKLQTNWRHGRIWIYGTALCSSLVALLVSFILSADILQLARHPESKLNCDINAVLSCSTVSQSWQSEILHGANWSIPNAFLGIAAESVFITICVIGLTGTKLPNWFNRATWWGSLAALTYAYWLFSQSLFVIKALCPWCLVLMFSTTIQFMALTHATVCLQNIPLNQGRFSKVSKSLTTYYRLHYDLMMDIVWLIALVVLIIIVDGAAIF
jgi:uncharacterized membrane protein